jgi:hypothetical protein
MNINYFLSTKKEYHKVLYGLNEIIDRYEELKDIQDDYSKSTTIDNPFNLNIPNGTGKVFISSSIYHGLFVIAYYDTILIYSIIIYKYAIINKYLTYFLIIL